MEVPGTEPVSGRVVLGDRVVARVGWDGNRPLESRVERQLSDQLLGRGRFRMNLYVDGFAAHEEDAWYGRRVANATPTC